MGIPIFRKDRIDLLVGDQLTEVDERPGWTGWGSRETRERQQSQFGRLGKTLLAVQVGPADVDPIDDRCIRDVDSHAQHTQLCGVVEPTGTVADSFHRLDAGIRVEVAGIARLDLDVVTAVVVGFVTAGLPPREGEVTAGPRGIRPEQGFVDLVVSQQDPAVDLRHLRTIGVIGSSRRRGGSRVRGTGDLDGHDLGLLSEHRREQEPEEHNQAQADENGLDLVVLDPGQDRVRLRVLLRHSDSPCGLFED